jgi:hypothetical protein
MNQLSLPLVSLTVGVSFVAWRFIFHTPSQPPRPPGPKGLPLLGNIMDMPTEFQWLSYRQLAEQYG